jgi:DNA (cytosine-5)-methyltransferase 1
MDLAKLQGHKVSREAANKVSVPTPTASDASFDKPGLMRKVTRHSPNRGVGLPLWANRIATKFYLPTPIATDYKNGKSGAGYGANLPETAAALMPTPTTRDYKDGSQPHERDGKVQTDTVARAVLNSGEVLLGTPRANAANSSSKQVEAGAPKSRIEDQVLTTNWGKFEPAIRRWESIVGRPAPEPTKPDGKDGNHRLSSKFTEWMMGLPDGWITGHDLKRNDELKLAGNGVVPQQAELALRLLLELPEER